MLTIERIRAARERIAGRLHLTPALSATRIGADADVSLVLKCESLQKTGSFKPRGVLNKLADLDAAARKRGVIAVSAGNHAQALAWGSAAAGVQCTVVMPASATKSKIEASRGYGAEVVLHGATSTDAFERANELAAERGYVFVHPFDDELVMAGAGTVGLEIVEQVPDVEVVVVPIGGGGLIGGIAVAVRALAPSVQIFGVEPTGAAAMRLSLDEGRPAWLENAFSIADGLTPPMAGTLAFEIVRKLVDDVVLVSDDEIRAAMRRILTEAKLLAEGAGAAATAAILSHRLPIRPGRRVVSILSGGNVDGSVLASVL